MIIMSNAARRLQSQLLPSKVVLLYASHFLSKKLGLGRVVQSVSVRAIEVIRRGISTKQGGEAQHITFVAVVFVGELVGDGASRGFDESHIAALDHGSVGLVVDPVCLAIETESTESAFESPVFFQLLPVPLVVHKSTGSDNRKS